MTLIRSLLATFALFALVACSTLGVQSPTTFNEKALAATRTVQAVAGSASTLRAAGKLSDSDRDNVVATLRSVEQGIDIAMLTKGTDGMSKLEAQIAILTALQTYLATKGAK